MTAALIAIVEGHFLRPDPAAPGGWLPRAIGYDAYVTAKNQLWAEPSVELAPWALGLLDHPDFDAWECGAGILGQLAAAKLLTPALRDTTIAALDELLRRPIREDSKEMQAKDAAIGALGKLRAVSSLVAAAAIPLIRRECDPTVAEAIAQCAGQRFSTLDAALRWAKQQRAEATAQRTEWERATGAATPYTPQGLRQVGDVLEHPTHGRGVVRRIVDRTKIEVLFESGPRTLVHGR